MDDRGSGSGGAGDADGVFAPSTMDTQKTIAEKGTPGSVVSRTFFE